MVTWFKVSQSDSDQIARAPQDLCGKAWYVNDKHLSPKIQLLLKQLGLIGALIGAARQ